MLTFGAESDILLKINSFCSEITVSLVKNKSHRIGKTEKLLKNSIIHKLSVHLIITYKHAQDGYDISGTLAYVGTWAEASDSYTSSYT